MDSLKNKTILITGASKGIGKALAMKLSTFSVNLALVARSEKELAALRHMIIANGSKCEVFSGSVTDETFLQEVVQETSRHLGAVDILVNNAGYGIFKSTEETTAREWDEVFATNTKGTFLMTKAVLTGMKERKQGHIINIASDVAKRTFAGGALYCASKYAQDAFSMALRKEVRPFSIKVSVIYSGLVDSSFHADPEGFAGHADWLKNEDMANAITYVAGQPAHVVIDELMIHPLSQEY